MARTNLVAIIGFLCRWQGFNDVQAGSAEGVRFPVTMQQANVERE